MECKLMSIDSSTNATGYAFFINGVLKSYSTCDYSYIKNTQKDFMFMPKRKNLKL